MDFTDPRWTDAGETAVTAVVDGEQLTFPKDDLNRHWAALAESGLSIAAAPEPAPPAEAELIAHAANLRWRSEVAGIVVAGVSVATDDRSKTMILGARMAALADPGWNTIWHGAGGQTYPLDAAVIIAISDAVQVHINAGFSRFAALRSAILAGEARTFEEVDALWQTEG